MLTKFVFLDDDGDERLRFEVSPSGDIGVVFPTSKTHESTEHISIEEWRALVRRINRAHRDDSAEGGQ